jgi:para-nitrobenzyl esterase
MPAHLVTSLGLILTLGLSSSIADELTLRNPAAGPVSGQVDENGAISWRGIPYAQPPVGELRWKAPRALKPFTGTYAANSFSDFCTQIGHPLLDIDPSLYGRAIGSEDCLYLNIWAPPAVIKADKKAPGLPVMVWVHGGSNVGGSGSWHYGGHLAAAQDVIVVSFNYRLGVFGWFSHPSLRSTAGSELDGQAEYRRFRW